MQLPVIIIVRHSQRLKKQVKRSVFGLRRGSPGRLTALLKGVGQRRRVDQPAVICAGEISCTLPSRWLDLEPHRRGNPCQPEASVRARFLACPDMQPCMLPSTRAPG